MRRAPFAEVVGVDGLHLEDQEDDVHDEETKRRKEETHDVLLPPGARGERKEGREEDEVEVKIGRREPGVRGAGRKVGSLDEKLLPRRLQAGDRGALAETEQEFRGGRQDPLVRGGEQEPERERDEKADQEPEGGQAVEHQRTAFSSALGGRGLWREAQRRKISTPNSTTADCQITVCEESNSAGRWRPIQTSETTRIRFRTWIPRKPRRKPVSRWRQPAGKASTA